VQLTITTAIQARWGHLVDGLIHTHAWTVEATVAGPVDVPKVMPADDLEQILSDTVRCWSGHYLTHVDKGPWKGYQPLMWEKEATVEEIVRQLWNILDTKVPGLVEVALVEAHEFDRCRTVRLSRGFTDRDQSATAGLTEVS
jgi:6-pyruvoyl-tetrahydropterin synthase